MIEFLRHLFGFCGEHWHPNIFTILLGATGIRQALLYVKYKIKEPKQ